MISTPHRIFVLLGCFALVLVVLLTYHARRDVSGSKQLHDQVTQQQTDFTQSVLDLDSSLIRAMALDYTAWTDMCRFIETHDQRWATENLQTALKTYGAIAVWVYDAQGHLVNLSTQGKYRPRAQIRFGPKMLYKPGDPVAKRFFRWSGNELLEFFVTGIYRSDDIDRKRRCYGTFIVARAISTTTIKTLDEMLGGSSKLESAGFRHQDNDDSIHRGLIVSDVPLRDMDGTEVAVVTTAVERKEIATAWNVSSTGIRNTIMFGCLMLLVLSIVLYTLVSRPLRILTTALHKENPAALASLKASKTDFGSLAHALDVMFTQQRDVERAKESAEQATRIKSEFLANMSHEIRTPMHGLLGMGRMLLEEELPLRARSYAETVVQSAESLIQIVNDILDLSRIEAHKLELVSAIYDPVAIVEDVCRLFAPTAVQNRVRILWDVEPDVPWRVVGDPGRVRQILSNLVGNAIKFTSKGYVMVKVRRRQDGSLSFEVKDTGIGIPANRLEAVFESFTQADGGTSRRFGGSGLGLTISRTLVELMGGGMSVESTEGAGSTFRFWIKPTEAVAEDRILPLAGKRVALLDIDDLAQEALANALRSLGAIPTTDLIPQPNIVILPPDGHIPSTTARIVRLVTFNRTAGVTDAFIELPFHRDDIVRAVLEAREVIIENDIISAHLMRVLVAEDNLVNQKLAKWHLERMGFQVSVASNGRECLDMWRDGDYQLILMDVQMPEVSGIDASLEIRRSEGFNQHILIVALTASAHEKNKEMCIAAGMDAFIAKPFREQELKAVITDLGLLTHVERPKEMAL